MNCGIISGARRRSSGTVPPALITAGALAANTGNTTIAVAYPTGIAAGDIIFIHTCAFDTLAHPTNVSSITGSFTKADGTSDSDADYSDLWWKRADGTEGASETVTLANATHTGTLMAQMSAWRGCVGTGTPFEALTHKAQASTVSHVGSAITTLGANRKVISMFAHCTGNGVAGTNTNSWTEEWDNGTTQGQSGGYMNGSSLVVAAAGSVSAITRTMDSAVANISFTLALIPA
jgi:hypothetical protein